MATFLFLLLLYSPFVSLLAWEGPRWFLFLLRVVAIVNLIAVAVICGFRWGMTDYLHMHYVAHNRMVNFLLIYTWCFLTGFPALWVRMKNMRVGLPWVILIVAANVVWWTQSPYPTERVLRAHFLKHQAAFEQLFTMVQVDLPMLSAADSSGAGIYKLSHSSPQRLAAYKRALDSLGIQVLGFNKAKNGLSLIYSSRGGFSHRVNGYAYSPTQLVSWEESDPNFPRFKVWYRPLVSHWYLFDGTSYVVMPWRDLDNVSAQ